MISQNAISKDAGGRITTITKIEDTGVYKTMLQELKKNSAMVLK